MVVRKREGALTKEERRIVKALLARKWRNQDIQDLTNRGRNATVNSARITEVKQNARIKPATDDEVDFFISKKKAWDSKTGLNLFDDERLIRAREAIGLAVHVFNSPTTNFKTEVFAVLANVAWTYLMHEHYERKGVKIVEANGRTVELSKLLHRNDCPLSAGMKRNLEELKEIRDTAEHKLLGKSDTTWLPLFQACCLNFDKAICDLFGNELSLQNDLAFALQFAKLNIDQIATVQKYEVPEHIEALDARLREGKTDDELNDLEYQFRVVYTLDSASKSQSHIKFVHPGSEEGEKIRNILIKQKPADELYPHKPGKVCEFVAQRAGKRFTSHNHTQAWRKYKARPRSGVAKPDATNRKYCIYHTAHGDYAYSDSWVDFLVDKISTEEGFAEIRETRL
jgi:hypothetical protein